MEDMKCARITDAFTPLELTTLPVPPCPDDGLLLRMLSAGMCHSDLHLIDDETDAGNGNVFRIRDHIGDMYVGIIPGHEICGEVMEIGTSVPSSCALKHGDIVVVYPWRGCTNCEVCREGQSQLCDNNVFGTTDLGQGENAGGYASHIAVPEWTLAIRLPKGIPTRIACQLPCSAMTALNAVEKVRPALDLAVRVRGFANLLVIGCGGVGLWAVTLVKNVFGDRNVKVLCADIEQNKLDDATQLGADDALLWTKDSSIEELVDMTTMSGYNRLDAAVDFVATEKTSTTALRSLNKGGALGLVGLNGGELSLSIPEVISRSISIIGIRTAPKSTLRRLIELLSVTQPDAYPPTEIVTLREVNDVLRRMRSRTQKGRAVIQFND